MDLTNGKSSQGFLTLQQISRRLKTNRENARKSHK